MKTILFALVTSFVAMNAFASDIKCQIDNVVAGSDSEKSVPVSGGSSNQIIKDNTVEFEGSKVSVTYRKGGPYDGQSLLQMKFDDMVSSIYNVNESRATNYQLEKGDLRLQCWFE